MLATEHSASMSVISPAGEIGDVDLNQSATLI